MTGKTIVIPPWSLDAAVGYDAAGRQQFRQTHGLSDKFVVMHSGNHSPCHPLDTLLHAARALGTGATDAARAVVFCFVGGGSEIGAVSRFAAEHRLDNITCLPYQPLDRLSASLSAADLHIVVMGDPYVGIIHPCKIYNILRVGIPFLYIGPSESHVTDLIPDTLERGGGVWARRARHGDVDHVVSHIQEAARERLGRSDAERQVAGEFSQQVQLQRLVDVVAAVKTDERLAEAPGPA